MNGESGHPLASGPVGVVAVTLNWHAPDLTLAWAKATLTSPKIEFAVIVDNESDGSLRGRLADAGLLDEQRVLIIELPENRGFAGGMNAALSTPIMDNFQWVLAMNNDARIDSDSIRSLLDFVSRSNSIGLASPLIRNPDRSTQSVGGRLLPWLGQARHGMNESASPDFLTWACVLIRTRALRDIGLLDERFFMYWEDVDYSLRALNKGWTLAVVSAAAAVHAETASRERAGLRIKKYHSWSTVAFSLKHRGAWLVGALVWAITSLVAQTARADWLRARAHLAGLAAGCLGRNPAWRRVAPQVTEGK